MQGNRAPLSAIRIAKDGQVVEALARDCRHKVGSGTHKWATKSKTKTASADDSSGNAAVAQEPAARRCSRIANSRSGLADTAE